jgi:hypothetical protein
LFSSNISLSSFDCFVLPWMILRGQVERHLPKGGFER